MRQIISRISPRSRNGRLWRVGIAGAALLVSAVGLLTVSGAASADDAYKQISITMQPEYKPGTDLFRSVMACAPNRDDTCVNLTSLGESVFYESGTWFSGEVEIRAEPFSGRTWFKKIFTVCGQERGEWVSLQWWNPMASCQVAPLEPLVPGIPLEPMLPDTPLVPACLLPLEQLPQADGIPQEEQGPLLRQRESVAPYCVDEQPVEEFLVSEE